MYLAWQSEAATRIPWVPQHGVTDLQWGAPSVATTSGTQMHAANMMCGTSGAWERAGRQAPHRALPPAGE